MNIGKITIIKILRVKRNSIIFTPKTHIWCTLPYPGHKKGCPNYDKNPLCPPNIKIMEKHLENYSFFYLIYAIFNIFKYKNNMLNKHPDWSDRKARCLLYWQNSVKKLLKEYIISLYLTSLDCSLYLFGSGSGDKIHNIKQEKVYSMEAVGINVIQTLLNNKIKIEVKPKKFVHIVNLLCSNKELKLINENLES